MALRGAPLITPKDLFSKITAKGNIRVLDCTWHLPTPGSPPRNAREDFHSQHIPGAQFFDIDANSDQSSPYEHMLPPPAQFEESAGKLGINNDTHVIVYDNNTNFGVFSAQRVWWTFRVFGHDLVTVLDGGLPRWKKEGLPVTAEIETVPKQTFRARFNTGLIKYFEDMEQNIRTKEYQVIDARSAPRFHGKAPEPREGEWTISVLIWKEAWKIICYLRKANLINITCIGYVCIQHDFRIMNYRGTWCTNLLQGGGKTFICWLNSV